MFLGDAPLPCEQSSYDHLPMKDMFTPRRLCYNWFHYKYKNIANNKTRERKDAPIMGDFNSFSRAFLAGLRQIKKQFHCLSVNRLSLKDTMG